jgi:hypothetical protein
MHAVYVDVGNGASDSATISFSIDGAVASNNRAWDIKVTQYTCYSENAYDDKTSKASRINPFHSFLSDLQMDVCSTSPV